jgi:ABC-type phosphate transport system auxiliary subunit
MAKRKTPKVKNLRPEKITDEQLTRVQNAVRSVNDHQIEIGRIETRKHQMLHNLSTIQDQLTLLQDELQKEYSTVDINIETGEINYPPDNGETDKKD